MSSEFNPLVLAKIRTELAKANERVARLEARERETPILPRGGMRIGLGKQMREAKSQRDTWQLLAAAAEPQEPWTPVVEGGEIVAFKSPQPDPEPEALNWGDRVVAFRTAHPQNYTVCIRCKVDSEVTDATPLTAEDLPDGFICSACGKDVLA